MAHAAKKLGYSLLVSETDETGLANSLESASDRMIDGVVLYAPRLRIADETLLALCNDIPLVRRDYVPESRLTWVGFDQVKATRSAVEHLLALGHRQIAAVPPIDDILNGYWRHKAWVDTLAAHGLQPGPSSRGDYSMSSGYSAACRVLESGQPFSAIVVGTDNMAVGVLRALREQGLRVPDDVSVIGMDNSEIAVYLDPPLTTVDFYFRQQDEIAIQSLTELLANPTTDYKQHILSSELIVRESTRAVAIGEA
jgi:DNA-binding LacI/PurR family transcriptional regulator